MSIGLYIIHTLSEEILSAICNIRKNLKILRICLTEYVQDPCSDNHKTLLRVRRLKLFKVTDRCPRIHL